MRVLVDRDRCEGHGMCEERAPELFRLDDDGELEYRYEGRAVPESLQADAAGGVSVCPVAALKLQR